MSTPTNYDDIIHVKFVCLNNRCREEDKTFTGTIHKYQLGLTAIWFHSSHEGHAFEYYENGELILS